MHCLEWQSLTFAQVPTMKMLSILLLGLLAVSQITFAREWATIPARWQARATLPEKIADLYPGMLVKVRVPVATTKLCPYR